MAKNGSEYTSLADLPIQRRKPLPATPSHNRDSGKHLEAMINDHIAAVGSPIPPKLPDRPHDNNKRGVSFLVDPPPRTSSISLLGSKGDAKSRSTSANKDKEASKHNVISNSSQSSTKTLASTVKSPEMTRRNNIALEILTTEQSYLASLTTIQDAFINPLLSVMGSEREIISRKVFDKIIPSPFANIYELCRSLLARLNERLLDPSWDPSTGRLGDIFLDTIPYLKMYSVYIQNFNGALSLIEDQSKKNPKLSAFLHEESMKKAYKGLPIQAYLMTPVQRIPRYKLLLQDLLKYTPVNHIDRTDLERAFKLVEEVAIFVDDMVRKQENQAQLLEIDQTLTGFNEKVLSPSRLFLFKGDLYKICRKNHQLRRVYVLSDMIICAIPSLLNDQFTFKRKFDLEFCEIRGIPDTDAIKHSFQLISPGKSYAFYADSEAEKLQWVRLISRAIKECRSDQKNRIPQIDLASQQKRTTMGDYKAPIWIPDDQASNFLAQHSSSESVWLPDNDITPARACDQCFVKSEGKYRAAPARSSSPGGDDDDEAEQSLIAQVKRYSSWLITPTVAAHQTGNYLHRDQHPQQQQYSHGPKVVSPGRARISISSHTRTLPHSTYNNGKPTSSSTRFRRIGRALIRFLSVRNILITLAISSLLYLWTQSGTRAQVEQDNSSNDYLDADVLHAVSIQPSPIQALPSSNSADVVNELNELPVPTRTRRRGEVDVNKLAYQGKIVRGGIMGHDRGFEDAEKMDFVREMTKHAWSGYYTYASGSDELLPVTSKARNWSREGSLLFTPIDSLDTLYIMELDDEYSQAKNLSLTLNLDQNIIINVFEAIIRLVGGLLAAYDLTSDTKLLDLAVSVADALLPAFNDNYMGLPSNSLNLQLGLPMSGSVYTLAQLGSSQLEFQYLTDVTNDPVYSLRSLQVLKKLKVMERPIPGLFPIHMNAVDTGKDPQKLVAVANLFEYSLGSESDSFYEYLLKLYLSTGSEQYWEMYTAAADAFSSHLVMDNERGNLFIPKTTMDNRTKVSFDATFEHLSCFAGGMFGLGALSRRTGNWTEHLHLGKRLTETCYKSYSNTATGLGAEGTDPLTLSPTNPSHYYILRPETIESIFYMWRFTHDPIYREWGWEIAQSINKHCRTDSGFSGLRNVMASGDHDNRMESFFIAETLKYLYLLFATDDLIPLETYVFTTEAHPLSIRGFGPRSDPAKWNSAGLNDESFSVLPDIISSRKKGKKGKLDSLQKVGMLAGP
ncbi:hypothetical protein SmJEL517_g06146 [Synchytrium microbalum]|uniref:alpha-1,2-Mannosidase n=1 Tax=Synchytrium microbalum TaxID=1806994 RepID=A0A507BWX7_9FUNG|nr:uncharacterized protein SmJEL517_g06146 [Synchytrium microbalum]TPX30256.1 hypothetical protein SmJEL517_g06146 [Synchytrium microbalum]